MEDNFDPSKATTSLMNSGEYRYTDVPCCDTFKELAITGEINLMLPRYNGDKGYIWTLNTVSHVGQRWHRIAVCPFCGTDKSI